MIGYLARGYYDRVDKGVFMKIKFEIYSSLLPEVKSLTDSVNKTMKDTFGENTNLMAGWKIGEVTVTLPEVETKESIKLKLEKVFREKVTEQNIWLKEVGYEKENS